MLSSAEESMSLPTAAEPVRPSSSPAGKSFARRSSSSLCSIPSSKLHVADGHELAAQLEDDQQGLAVGADGAGEFLADHLRLVAQHAEDRAAGISPRE